MWPNGRYISSTNCKTRPVKMLQVIVSHYVKPNLSVVNNCYLPWERAGKVSTHVCLYVTISDDNFWTDWPIDLIFCMLVGHYNI